MEWWNQCFSKKRVSKLDAIGWIIKNRKNLNIIIKEIIINNFIASSMLVCTDNAEKYKQFDIWEITNEKSFDN